MSEHEVEFRFLNPGLSTTLQDAGRNGFQHLGVPVGGVLDRGSAAIANRLVNNLDDAPVLEITLLGPTIDVSGRCQIALAGADLSPAINGIPIPTWQTINVLADDRLTFGKTKLGCRAYLAFGGKWSVQKWLGSCSAAVTEANILTPDSVFDAGTMLRGFAKPKFSKRKLNPIHRLPLSDEIEVRVHTGPEFEWLTEAQRNSLLGTPFTMSPQSNRMGCRLIESVSNYQEDREMISSGIVPGTIQLQKSGQPVVLLQDAQTTGGYPRVLVVAQDDIDLIGQLRPGQRIQFRLER